MIKNLDADIQRLLASLDPARAPYPEATPQQRAETLNRILATAPPPTPRRAVTRRTLILAGGAAAVIAGAAAGLGSVLVGGPTAPEPAHAATPKLLDDRLLGPGQPAVDRLTQLAAAARGSAAPPSTGEYAHLRTQSWSLSIRIDGHQVTSAVIPEIRESWRAPDNSGRLIISYGPPEFATEEDRRTWESQGLPGAQPDVEVTDFEPGQFVGMWPDQAPQDADELRQWLAVGHPVENGPVETLVAVTDLLREQVVGPAVRAALLEILSELPDIRYAGDVTDRAGRVGSAFFIDSDRSGLPTRYVLIVDSEGQFLSYEQILTRTAGKLGVSIPAVIGYEMYLVAEFSELPSR
jgi:hypothetical protein